MLGKLQYGLESAWLNQCERRRLDAFYCKCIRRILKIKHSYFSRVSNAQFLATAKEEPVSISMIKQQLKAFGRIALSSDTNPLRSLVFANYDRFDKFDFNPRPVGKPKQCWVDEMHKLALAICSSVDNLADTFHQCTDSLDPWSQLINEYFALNNID